MDSNPIEIDFPKDFPQEYAKAEKLMASDSQKEIPHFKIFYKELEYESFIQKIDEFKEEFSKIATNVCE